MQDRLRYIDGESWSYPASIPAVERMTTFFA
jgi:hypothetical protein